MELYALLVLTVGLLIAAGDRKDDAAKKDLAALQGTWILVSAERDGKKLSQDEVKKTKITFNGETFVFPDASGIATSQRGIIKVDPSKTPKWMDSKDAAKGERSFGHLRDRRRRLQGVLRPARQRATERVLRKTWQWSYPPGMET